jgi:hypothetical protein
LVRIQFGINKKIIFQSGDLHFLIYFEDYSSVVIQKYWKYLLILMPMGCFSGDSWAFCVGDSFEDEGYFAIGYFYCQECYLLEILVRVGILLP